MDELKKRNILFYKAYIIFNVGKLRKIFIKDLEVHNILTYFTLMKMLMDILFIFIICSAEVFRNREL